MQISNLQSSVVVCIWMPSLGTIAMCIIQTTMWWLGWRKVFIRKKINIFHITLIHIMHTYISLSPLVTLWASTGPFMVTKYFLSFQAIKEKLLWLLNGYHDPDAHDTWQNSFLRSWTTLCRHVRRWSWWEGVFLFQFSNILCVSIISDHRISSLQGDVVCRKHPRRPPTGVMTSPPFLSVPLPQTSVKTFRLNYHFAEAISQWRWTPPADSKQTSGLLSWGINAKVDCSTKLVVANSK